MKDFEKAEEDKEEEEEKIRVEVGFFDVYFYALFLSPLKRVFELDFSSLFFSLQRGALFDATDASFVSLFTAALSSLETTDEKHCELGAWVKVESGETQKWFGRVRFM